MQAASPEREDIHMLISSLLLLYLAAEKLFQAPARDRLIRKLYKALERHMVVGKPNEQ